MVSNYHNNCSDIGHASEGSAVDAGLPSINPEVTELAPRIAPLVLADPNKAAPVILPADQLDGMPAFHDASYVLVNTIRIDHEIGINGEADHHRTIGHQLVLDVVYGGRDSCGTHLARVLTVLNRAILTLISAKT